MTKFAMKCKEAMIKDISLDIEGGSTFVITSYKGLTAQEINVLRKELRTVSGEYLVVKNSMMKRALTQGRYENMKDLIEGEVGIAIDKKEDPCGISKVLVKFSKDHELLDIKGGLMDGALISKQEIISLAALPSREVLLGKLANVLNAPIQGLAGSLKAIISKLVYALDAVKNKKSTMKK